MRTQIKASTASRAWSERLKMIDDRTAERLKMIDDRTELINLIAMAIMIANVNVKLQEMKNILDKPIDDSSYIVSVRVRKREEQHEKLTKVYAEAKLTVNALRVYLENLGVGLHA